MAELLPATPLELAAAFLVTAASALLQGTIGFGFAVVAVPVCSLIDPVLAPVPQLLVTPPLTLAMLWRERHALELRGVTWVLVGRLPGALIGLTLLKVATTRTLDFLIGASVLLAVFVVATGLEIRRTRVTEFGAGVAAGITGLVASIGGPPIALLYRNAGGPTMRATLAGIFTVGMAVNILTRGFGGEIRVSDLYVASVLLPALLLGVWGSRPLVGRVEGEPLRRAVLLVASAAAGGLLLRAALG